ncbi:amidohydrolase family protein [Ilumatobacter sp.]|uniref:amidohydrolase family protein n=1 Tax=Ilumatobacter sp. TaxID=1967498 RepID=UPI003C46D1E2
MNSTVDAHHHLWDLELTPQPWIEGDLAPINRNFHIDDYIDAAGDHVGRSVVVQTVADPGETPLLLSIAERTELIGGVVGWVDLTADGVEDRIGELLSSSGAEWLVGIRHLVQDEPDPRWLCRPDVRRGLDALGRAGLPYDLLTLPNQLEAAIETVSALPAVSFVVDHLSKPSIADGTLEPWATDLARLGRFPNVTCKLSGMITEADWSTWTVDDLRRYADIALDVFGADRMMFGSDWPVCLLAGSYDRVVETAHELTAGLDTAERDAVFGRTATRVYGLDRRGPGNDRSPATT